MKRIVAVGAVASTAIAACFFEPSKPGGMATGDGGVDAMTPCPGSSHWSTPRQLTELASNGMSQFSPWLSKDKSELWFSGYGNGQLLFYTTWNGSAWGSATRVDDFDPLNQRPHLVISDNRLVAWFTKMQSDDNIYTASRATPSAPFNIDGMASFSMDGSNINEDDPAISGDGTWMVFTQSNGGTSLPGDLMITSRPSVTDAWGTPMALTLYNTAMDDCCAALSEDANTLMFATNITTDYTIKVATRPDNLHDFGSATPWPGNIAGNDNYDPVLSRDGRTVIFASGAGTGSDRLYESDLICQ